MNQEKRERLLGLIARRGAAGCTTGELAEETGVSDPRMTRDFAELRDSGYIVAIGKVKNRTGKRGRVACYHINDGAAETLEPDIFEQCRANWQGYKIHKIFGSASRASA